MQHKLFYFPYASLTDAQLPLLKVAALYFDKLVMLDPVGASWDGVGTTKVARSALGLLDQAGLLEAVSPADVVATYEAPMIAAIRRDVTDQAFLELCRTQASAKGKDRWTLALAKVPKELQADAASRRLLGDLARDIAKSATMAADDYIENIEALSYLPGGTSSLPPGAYERAEQFREFSRSGRAYDEGGQGYEGAMEYRYVDLPLALGEAIMVNHALFGGLLHADATPLTDDPFHSRALALKLKHAAQLKEIRDVIESRSHQRQIKANQLALATLSDSQLDLPILDPNVPIEEVLEYRLQNDDALKQVRDEMGWLARKIEAEPWTADFAATIEHKTIPEIAGKLKQAAKARDGWLKSKRGRLMLKATGLAAGTAAATLAIIAAPATPIALAIAGLGIAGGSAIPAAEWLLDWRDGKKSARENGLHYLLKV